MPTSSLCLDGLIVVDCGLGVTRGLVDQGMRSILSLIFITHLHSITISSWVR